MKLLVDMNLSPRFVSALNDSGFFQRFIGLKWVLLMLRI